ncbi:MAG: 3-hydroxyacyl-[acyl-carrier-protein] dehydratase FabZ [Rhodospirillaceae bacterium]|nr:3-hydroxyacyl-[acyl-carrier-protein] dehydratase FabZ [Rhodospirillaceae bacterium]|tara:strand:+ start:107 stop:586 length:480 start_codon:yes stop_codon:yes gene_type:complete
MNDPKPVSELGVADIHRVLAMIPHRYPMLMVDRVVDLVTDKSATGIKNVTANEPYFQGHFPSRPVMPGVMIVEAMAQTAAVLVVHTLGDQTEGKLVYFMSIDKARFRKPVEPGDTMRIHVTREHHRGNVWKFSAQAKVEGELVAEASCTAMITDDDGKA